MDLLPIYDGVTGIWRGCYVTEFPVIPSQTGILFFDTLNHYLHPEDRAARAAVEASGIIGRMVKLNRACREAGIAVFYGAADHRPDGKDFAPHIVDRGYGDKAGEPPRRTTPPPVSAAGPARDVIPELAPQPGDYVIKKHRWSTFFQTHLELSLRTASIDTLILVGGATEIGIASTAYSGRDLDINQIIVRDACSSALPGVNEFFMDNVFPIFARVMSVDQVIASIAVSRSV